MLNFDKVWGNWVTFYLTSLGVLFKNFYHSLCVHLTGYAYGVSLLTYDGNVDLGVIGLRNFFPNNQHPIKFNERVIEEWDQLESVICT